MSSYFSGSHSGGGSAYFGGSAASGPAGIPASHHAGGLVGLAENLGHDVVHSIVGIPEGLVQTVEHPIGTAKAIAKQYAATYGPLTHGDVGKFLHNVYEHPLGPVLDLTTVLSLGATGLERLGVAPEVARSVELRSPAALAGQDVKDVLKRPVTGGPLQRAVKIQAHHLLNRLPHDFPLAGETTRFGHELEKLPRTQALAARTALRDYTKSTKNLSNEEFAALHLIGRGLHPQDYLSFLKAQGSVEPVMLKVLDNPKINHLVENPTPRLLKAVDAAKRLSEADAGLKIGRNLLTPETAAERIGRPAATVHEALGKLGKHNGQEFTPRAVAGERFYVPDVMPGERVANADFAKMGGGFGVPKLPGSLKENKGVLLRTGRLALHPDLLGPEYLKTIKYGLFDDIHSELMSHAVRLDVDHLRTMGLPKGWVLLRRKVISSTGNPRAQQVGSMLKASGDIKRGLEDLVGEAPETFSASSLSDAARVHGQYLAVPERLAKDLAGEFRRSNEAVRLFIEKPTKVWRGLVLGLRVGFLTNNVVGNHLLFALHAAGIDGLRAYLNAVRRVKGARTVRTLIEDRSLPPALRQQFMDEFFPEHVEGTFGKAQKPTGVVSERLNKTRVGRAVQQATLGLAPATQAIAEGNLRRALVEYYIRKDPEWRRVYNDMPKQTREFEAAAKTLLEGKGGHDFQRRVSMQVNKALGDYLNLGPVARIARGIFPFAAWYKAILSIAGHLAVDAPGRTDLLTRIGQAGAEDTAKYLAEVFGGNVPDYLLGLLPLGNRNVATTSGINPFQTISQLGQGAVDLLTGKPGATGRAFANLGPNPILLAAIQSLAGKDLFTGRTLNGSGGLPGQVIEQVLGQLPQAQLGKALLGHGKVTKTYGKQTGGEAALQFLGLPIKRLASS